MSESAAVLDLPPAPPHLRNDPVLRRARDGLRKIYGDRLAGVILFGSRARGDQRPDSDYDLIALIQDYARGRDRKGDLHDLERELVQLDPYEIEVSIRPMDAGALGLRTGFMFNVRKEGLRL